MIPLETSEALITVGFLGVCVSMDRGAHEAPFKQSPVFREDRWEPEGGELWFTEPPLYASLWKAVPLGYEHWTHVEVAH